MWNKRQSTLLNSEIMIQNDKANLYEDSTILSKLGKNGIIYFIIKYQNELHFLKKLSKLIMKIINKSEYC